MKNIWTTALHRVLDKNLACGRDSVRDDDGRRVCAGRLIRTTDFNAADDWKQQLGVTTSSAPPSPPAAVSSVPANPNITNYGTGGMQALPGTAPNIGQRTH